MAASGGTQDKRAFYWLGERLIDYRLPVTLVVVFITAFFAWHAFQLRLVTSFGDLLPQTHPFVKVHNKYAPTFGGANNIQVMLEMREGDIFTVETLTRIFKMTEAVDRVYGVNHNQIDSIGHRTTRYLKVASGGLLRAEPIMIGLPKRPDDATKIKRIVHNTESVYGLLVSLDDKAALIRANFIEGRLDHRLTFKQVNEKVLAPFGDGWIGAMIAGIDVLKPDAPAPAVVESVFENTVAQAAGLKEGDVITAVGDQQVASAMELGAVIAALTPGSSVPLTVTRGGSTEKLTLAVPQPSVDISVAGEPRLYGWVYNYASDVFWILTVTYCLEWLLRWLYFHDWRGSLRPTLTGVIAAFWGLGFINIIGLSLDPLALVIPFLITARAVSHAIQMHDRYYEEFEASGWDKRKAIVAAFAELLVPTMSGIVTDALGVLVILFVPVVMLQKLAIVASWWILAITVAELMLNPIVYYYLREPDPDLVKARETGWVRRLVDHTSHWTVSTGGRRTIYGGWAIATCIGAYFMRGLIIGDPTTASPLVQLDSPYNVSHARIQDKFGGVEPLIVVAEGYDKDAMKDPATLRKMEEFQRFLERDRDVGYSFSLVDILRGVNSVFHELEPKWGVIPNSWVDVGTLFFVFFSGSPPTETAKYVDASYTTSHVTFFCKNHKGDNVDRIIHRCQEFIADRQLEDLGLTLAAKDGSAVVAGVAPEPQWVAAPDKDGMWTVPVETQDTREVDSDDTKGRAYQRLVATGAATSGPFRPGDVIKRIGKVSVDSPQEVREALGAETADQTSVGVVVERDGSEVEFTLGVPWKAVFKLAGGLIGVLAAANDVMVRNDLMMNVLGFVTIYVILIFTYQSWIAGLFLMAPLFISNILVNGYMAAQNIGINVNTLPIVTLGLGFGIDYGLYVLSRIIEEIRENGDLEKSVLQALRTSGKGVAFTAVTMVTSTYLWVFSNIRFNAEMGALLALWMGVSFVASQTLLPVLLLTFKPKFLMREIAHAKAKGAAA
jgi:predicted RND superfamily exporter protein